MRWGLAVKIPSNIFFYDVDSHLMPIRELRRFVKWSLLTYKTRQGYHFFYPRYIPFNVGDELKKYLDSKCPCDAVRVYPDDDYLLLNHQPGLNIFTDYLAMFHKWYKEFVDLKVPFHPYLKPREKEFLKNGS